MKRKREEIYIRLDWAIKRLLRHKSNFVVLEGLFSTLLGEDIKISQILDSESSRTSKDNKQNLVDILAINSLGEMVIIEVQNTREYDYFQRILYGVSKKTITEYINNDDKYKNVKKVYHISIVYFNVGQGKDYVYRGRTDFHGIHCNDILKLSETQKHNLLNNYDKADDFLPEYYILRIKDFNKNVVDPLDEWISFLKTDKIPDSYTAKGLPEAREILKYDSLTIEDQEDYDDHLENTISMQSGIDYGRDAGYIEGKKAARTKIAIEIAANLLNLGLSIEDIAEITELTPDEIKNIQK